MDLPLLGRAAELHHVTRCLRRGGGIALAGPAGVGKTRLAEEAARAVAEDGCEVVWAAATSASAGIPFGAVSHLVPAADRPLGDHLALLQHTRAALRRRAHDRRLVVVVDDAHLLDDGSATLLHQLALAGEATLLTTVRSGEPTPDPVLALWKDDLVDRCELVPLSRASVEELVDATLRGTVAPSLNERLWELSLGNPLYLRECLRGGIDTGALRQNEAGYWQLVGELVPSTWLAEIVGSRLRRLDEDARAGAELIALGEPLELALVEELAGRGAVETLERTGTIRTSTTDATADRHGSRETVRLVHPVYAEVLRADLPRARARRIARQLAETFEARGLRDRDGLLRTARWRLEAGGPYAPDDLLAAAAAALDTSAPELAERCAWAAAAGGAAGFELELTLGKSIAWQHRRVDEADAHLRSAEGLAEDDAQRARAALARARALFYRAGRARDAMAVATAASERVRDEDWRDELGAMVALVASVLGDLPVAAAAGERIKGRPDPGQRAVRTTLAVAAFSEVLLGRFAAAHRSVEMVRGSEVAAGDRAIATELVDCYAAMGTAYAGDIVTGVAAARAGFSAACSERVDVAGPWGDVLCHLLILRGRVGEAVEVGARTAALLSDRDPFGVAGMTIAGWAYAAAIRGDRGTTERLLTRLADDRLPDVRPAIFADLARARLAAWRGELSVAGDLAAEAGADAVAGSHVVWGGFLLHEAVRLGRPRAVVDGLARVAETAEGRLLPTFAEHAVALHRGDAEVLERIADAYASMGADLHAAEAAAQAAAAFGRDGQMRQATRLGARSAAWAARCEGAWAPDLSETTATLTAREREIALLAAHGRASKAIAERLVISPRTVDNHLRAVYQKLGVDGRSQLTPMLITGADRAS